MVLLALVRTATSLAECDYRRILCVYITFHELMSVSVQHCGSIPHLMSRILYCQSYQATYHSCGVKLAPTIS
jgi:hypothetical protein